MKPFQRIGVSAALAQPTELQADVATMRQSALEVGKQVAYQVRAVAALARKHGLANLLAAMNPEESEVWRTLIASTKSYWESNSDEAFPEIPEQPTPTE